MVDIICSLLNQMHVHHLYVIVASIIMDLHRELETRSVRVLFVPTYVTKLVMYLTKRKFYLCIEILHQTVYKLRINFIF